MSHADQTAALLEYRGVSKEYGRGDNKVCALRNLDLTIRRGDFVSIMGPSGSGKSTLLNLGAGLDFATSGVVSAFGQDLASIGNAKLARMRAERIAVIFQFFNLLDTLTAEENVAMPLRTRRLPRTEVDERVADALAAVDMSHRARHYAEQLSGGEMQRVAIARALATQAELILADEPTGNLDTLRGESVLELLKRTTEDRGCAVVLVTHDLQAASYGDRIVTLRDGKIADIARGTQMVDVLPDSNE